MQIIHHITLDMVKPTSEVPLDAVQGDGNTRLLRLTLLENGENWATPAGVTAAVAFRKADGTKGLYDTLPDGAKAVTVEGNAVTAVLARQALSCPGDVSAAVVFHDSNLNQLATFPFTIRVKANPAAGKQVSNDYYQYSTMEEVSEAVEAALAALEDNKQDFLAKAEEALQVVHDTATENAPAVICEAFGESITVSDAAGRPLKGLSIYGKTVQNGTPTPENPVELVSTGESGAINTKIGDYITSKVVPGLTGAEGIYNPNSGGRITTADFCRIWEGNYVLNCANTSFTATIVVFDLNGNVITGESYADKWYSLPLSFSIKGDRNIKVTISGTPDTNYRPFVYKENEPVQTLTASMPNGLPGIPVSSGGNYTDENGQAWICDEIDFARGVRVQRVAKSKVSITSAIVLEATSAVCGLFFGADKVCANNAGSICEGLVFTTNRINPPEHHYYENQGNFVVAGTPEDTVETLREKYNGLEYCYVLAAPVETALSAEELAQFAALHTNKPNTTVFNDSGAGMKISYVADTKTYIDNKLAAISAAMLNA